VPGCCCPTRSRFGTWETRRFGSWSARARRIELGTPAVVYDVEFPRWGRHGASRSPRSFQGFAYLLDGEAAFGRDGRRARPPQLVLLGPGDELAVTDAAPGTRFLLMAGKPYGEAPVFNGPYVD
jgi:redox-sensitive bicupin YhaK (pirin superfamily)